MPEVDAVTMAILATPPQIMVDLQGWQKSWLRPTTIKKSSSQTPGIIKYFGESPGSCSGREMVRHAAYHLQAETWRGPSTVLTCSSPSAKITTRMGAAQSWCQSKDKACGGSIADLSWYVCCHSLCGTTCNRGQTETLNCCRKQTRSSGASRDRPPGWYSWLLQKGHNGDAHRTGALHRAIPVTGCLFFNSWSCWRACSHGHFCTSHHITSQWTDGVPHKPGLLPLISIGSGLGKKSLTSRRGSRGTATYSQLFTCR